MAHTCKAAILHCIDFRLGKDIKKYLEEQNLLGDCDVVSIAGAVKTLVAPGNGNEQAHLLNQFNISKRLHGISEVILMNHTDCGAYGGRAAFGSEDEEKTKHVEDMKSAGALIKEHHPDVNIRYVLAHLDGHEVRFEELQFSS